MMGAEIAVGYLCAYLVRKARRAGDAADAEVDRTVDAGMAKVHDLVTRALGEDPALDQARSEAASEQAEVSEGTRRWVTHALTGAAQGDAALAQALADAVKEVQAATAASTEPGAVTAQGEGIAVGGGVSVKAEAGGVAALRMRDVSLGNPQAPGPQHT
ncbi:hypothetical protein [Streptomyces sp. IBSBF 2435]|uniref:hypothetical protein n=1 Tax=Streptomyces sp. IBSBF 2435 TaxID=2903531 RepID=UPI002FDBF016